MMESMKYINRKKNVPDGTEGAAWGGIQQDSAEGVTCEPIVNTEHFLTSWKPSSLFILKTAFEDNKHCPSFPEA